MNAQLFLECGFVGFYCVLLFFLFQFCIENTVLALFCFGFTKHFLGYWLGLHGWYCDSKNKGIANTKDLLLFSFLEGLYFVVAGELAFWCVGTGNNKLKNKKKLAWTVFGLGAATHLLAEILSVHSFFLVHNCEPLYS